VRGRETERERERQTEILCGPGEITWSVECGFALVVVVVVVMVVVMLDEVGTQYF
jgi:hypothetical protein